jgi:hypothetical protein
MRVWVYVDAFNLYYGALKGTKCRWLNLGKLCDLLLSKHEVERIRYFTALVAARPHKPGQHLRQRRYIQAIETDRRVSVHYGRYVTGTRRAPMAKPPHTPVEYVHTEEKGSDVNLASYLLFDAFHKRYEMGAVISNDSDLVEPIRLVREEFKVPVLVLNPHKRPCAAMKACASQVYTIRRGPVTAAQFPSCVRTAEGKELWKPKQW